MLNYKADHSNDESNDLHYSLFISLNYETFDIHLFFILIPFTITVNVNSFSINWLHKHRAAKYISQFCNDDRIASNNIFMDLSGVLE